MIKTIKIESEEFIELQELSSNRQNIQARIGSHEERIMELQSDQALLKNTYNLKHQKICLKYRLDPSGQYRFEPKMNVDISTKPKDKKDGKQSVPK